MSLIQPSGSISTSFSSPAVEALGEFEHPAPEAYNVTLANWTEGYNPWMPQYLGGDPDVTTYVLVTGGCLPADQQGSATAFIDVATGFAETCGKFNMTCQCRPSVEPKNWNVAIPEDLQGNVTQGIHHCSWEIRLILDEHRRGVINVGGISAQCSLHDPEIYNEARELGVPIYLIDRGPPRPEDEDYGLPEPEGYISIDDEFLGRSMARLLQQLRPEGGRFGFIMKWESPAAQAARAAFIDEMIVQPSDKDDVPEWKEVHRYPFERPYNISVPCKLIDCAMNGLAENSTVTAIIFLYERPLRNSQFKSWVETNRQIRNYTLISIGTRQWLHYLDQGYLDGLVSHNRFDVGKQSAEILRGHSTELTQTEVIIPTDGGAMWYETGLVSNNVVPTDLDELHPPMLEDNLLGDLRYGGYTVLGIVLLSCLLCTLWTIYNRNGRIVRASQPFFLLILISGIVILSSTIIPLSFDDEGDMDSLSDSFSIGVCMAQPWLAFTGFTVIFSALFSKTWRVNRMFHSMKVHVRVQVTLMDVAAPFAVIFTSNVVVLLCWTLLDPLKYTRLVGDGTDLWNRDIESYGACRSDKALAFLIPLAALNFAVLAISCWQAFEGRKIDSAFAESKYIGFAVASLFQAFITCFPILVVVKDEPRAFYLVLTLTIFILCEGILLLLFLPKMYMQYKFSRMSEAEQKEAMAKQIGRSAKSAGSFAMDSGVSGQVVLSSHMDMQSQLSKARNSLQNKMSSSKLSSSKEDKSGSMALDKSGPMAMQDADLGNAVENPAAQEAPIDPSTTNTRLSSWNLSEN